MCPFSTKVGGCQGALKIYPDRMAYESADKPEHSRYWRYSDIQGFGRPARYRFEITTFEDKFGGPAKVYDFQLKEDLPAPAYDYVWVRVNPAELYPPRIGRCANTQHELQTGQPVSINKGENHDEQ